MKLNRWKVGGVCELAGPIFLTEKEDDEMWCCWLVSICFAEYATKEYTTNMNTSSLNLELKIQWINQQ